MKIVNINDIQNDSLLYCYDEDIKKYLINNGIIYINKKENCWIFIKSQDIQNLILDYMSCKRR